MSASQTFKLRTPAHIESCHLVGSWDNYTKKMAMAQDTASGPGFWKMTLKFPSDTPTRFWYYVCSQFTTTSNFLISLLGIRVFFGLIIFSSLLEYQMLTVLQYVLDGYFESHDPNKPTCKEPTRGITLNILDCGPSREHSPSSSTSSRSSHSSRFPSPSSSAGTSPSSTHSHRSFRRQTPSPPPHRPASHIIQPTPRNPLTQHKLTLDTNCRPVSMMTDATAGDSPVSVSSSRSNSSIGSFCSSCSSNSTVFSEDSPTTPICSCRFTSEHRRGACEGSWDSEGESCCSEESCSEDDDEYERQQVRVSRRASYHPSKAGHGGQLAYELERKLRM